MGAESTSQSQGYRGDVDQVFSALASQERRKIVAYFENADAKTVTVTELVRECQQSQDGVVATESQLAARFHHQHLPKLADAGVVEYDRESQQVRYRGDPLVEDLVESTPDTNLKSQQ